MLLVCLYKVGIIFQFLLITVPFRFVICSYTQMFIQEIFHPFCILYVRIKFIALSCMPLCSKYQEYRLFLVDNEGTACLLYKILSCDGVTVDGVWIGNQVY